MEGFCKSSLWSDTLAEEEEKKMKKNEKKEKKKEKFVQRKCRKVGRPEG